MNIQLEHISSNCNPIPGCFDFLTDQIITYCYKNQVGLYSLTQNTVYCNVHCNKQINPNRANFIKTFSNNKYFYLIVGYDSGHLVTFCSQDTRKWSEINIIKQKSSILAFTLYEQYLAVQNNDALITLYKMEKSQNNGNIKWNEIEEIQFALNKTVQSIALQIIEKDLLLFLGGVDQKIHCYRKGTDIQNSELQYLFTLTGHQNAITKLVIVQENDSYILASCSKDGYIRLWKITSNVQETKLHKNVKTLLGDYRMFLESVLISHECSVTNLHWSRMNGLLQLISASLDCTVCVWSHSEEDGSWSVESRMGQFLGNKNAYFQVLSNNSGKQLAALNYIGSVLIWNYDKNQNKYSLRQSFNGHYSEVRDISWNHTGDFLVSVSKDQTTRVIAKNQKTGKYHQISRAQVHGYDINALCLINTKPNTIDLIACGADEKVVRIVEPPACFANFLNTFTGRNLHLYFQSEEEQAKYIQQKETKQKTLLYETHTEGGAQVLGLMTKATHVEKEKVVNYFDDEQQQEQILQDEKIDLKDGKKTDFSSPPNDDYLIKHTLWPQMNKLYAHPHQIQYLCKSTDNKRMASCCKGLTEDASQMIIWNTQNWKIEKIIKHHSYTVYCMQFSSSGKYFVSVSKDRKMAVFDQKLDFLYGYEPHVRAITCVSISENQQCIITGSRDKTIKLHSISQKKNISEFQFKKQVSSVSFCRQNTHTNLVCCGLLNGDVFLLEFNEQGQFEIVGQINNQFAHTARINAIRWFENRFAVCSEDHSVGIYRIAEDQLKK